MLARLMAGVALLTLVAGVSTAEAQGRRGGGFGMDMMTLVSMDKVKDEIDLQDFQTDELTKLAEQMDKDFPRPNFQNFFQLSPEEQTKARTEMQAQAEKKAVVVREKLGKLLLPPQMKRLSEIFVQAQGANALRDAVVAKELMLTEDQQKQIAAVLQKSQDDMMKLFREAGGGGGGGGGAPSPELMEKVGKMRADAEKESLAVLKDEQKKKFEELKGKPFELPRFGPGGGGGGGAAKTTK